MCDARPKTRVRYKKAFDALAITGQDYYQILALIFHHLQKDLDCFLPVILLVFRTVQIVGFVDEEHPAHGALEYLFGFRRSVADKLTDEVITRDWNEMAFAYVAETMKDVRHTQRHRGLASTWIAGEGHMQRGRFGGESDFLARARH